VDSKFSKAFWLGRNLNVIAMAREAPNKDEESLAKLAHSVDLFAKSLSIHLPEFPETNAIAVMRNTVREDLALVQSDLVAKCFLFGFDYSSWIDARGGYDWDQTDGTLDLTAVETNLRREGEDLGLGVELQACMLAAKDKSLSYQQFKQLSGYEILLKMTAKLDRLDPVSAGRPVSNDLFIVMPMLAADPALEDVVDAIKQSASSLGINAYRVDQLETSGKISDSIVEGLKSAAYIVVDLTHARPNVYWEAGFCHGLGKLPVYIARAGTNPEFDVKDYPVIYYSSMKQLREGLTKRLARQVSG
jgi:hypothetical protein